MILTRRKETRGGALGRVQPNPPFRLSQPRCSPRLSRVRWSYICVDEGHRLKNAGGHERCNIPTHGWVGGATLFTTLHSRASRPADHPAAAALSA